LNHEWRPAGIPRFNCRPIRSSKLRSNARRLLNMQCRATPNCTCPKSYRFR
jgi:hypothetical protein